MKYVKLELLTSSIYLTLLHGSLGYPTGTDSNRCDSMIPGHGQYQPTLSDSYTVEVSAESYKCGESLAITLASTGSDFFRGFLCQASTDVGDYSTSVGVLGQLEEDVMMRDNCGAGRSLTHTENDDKTLVHFTWFPDEDYGPVQIVCTVVKLAIYWVNNVTSTAITYDGNCRGVLTTPTQDKAVGDTISIVQTSDEGVMTSPVNTVSTTGVLGNGSSTQMQPLLVIWWLFMFWTVLYMTLA